MTCAWYDIACPYLKAAQSGLGSVSGAASNSAWSAVCQSFVDSASALFQNFGTEFTRIPDLDLGTAGIATPFGISVVIGTVVAALLVLGQVARTAWTHDGTGVAQAVAGVAKAVLAWLLTTSVATAALAASNDVTGYIVDSSFGSSQGLARKLGGVINWAGLQSGGLQKAEGYSLLLVLSLIGMVLVLVLWFELLLRNAALAVLIAVSPISAAGQVGEPTRAWWSRTVSAAVQLIVLKPIIAVVLAVGFAMAGSSTGIPGVLQGLVVLGLAVFAWPTVARFFSFSSGVATSGGLAGVIGFAAGTLAGRGVAGVNPGAFGRAAEGRTMLGRLAGPALGAGAVFLGQAHQAGSTVANRMEQVAAHAGTPAYSHSPVPGGGRRAPRGRRVED